MNSKDLLQLGVPPGDALKRAHEFILAFRDSGGDMSQLESEVAAMVTSPAEFLGDSLREAFARTLTSRRSSNVRRSRPGVSGARASSQRR